MNEAPGKKMIKVPAVILLVMNSISLISSLFGGNKYTSTDVLSLIFMILKMLVYILCVMWADKIEKGSLLFKIILILTLLVLIRGILETTKNSELVSENLVLYIVVLILSCAVNLAVSMIMLVGAKRNKDAYLDSLEEQKK